MLQGECDVRVGDRTMKLVRSDAGHPSGRQARVANNGWEPVIYVCRSLATRAARCSGTRRRRRPPRLRPEWTAVVTGYPDEHEIRPRSSSARAPP